MMQRSFASKIVATLVAVALQALMIPVSAQTTSAVLSGSVHLSTDQTPLTGAKLHVGDPKTGQVFTSQPTTADGSFRIGELPASTYEVAVEADGGLYVVRTPVRLAPGQTQTVSVAVNAQMAPDPATAKKNAPPARGSLWSNPATAALIVLGAALVLGVVIDEATDDDNDPASP